MKPMMIRVPRTSSTIALTEAMTVPSPILSKKNASSTDGAWNWPPSLDTSKTWESRLRDTRSPFGCWPEVAHRRVKVRVVLVLLVLGSLRLPCSLLLPLSVLLLRPRPLRPVLPLPSSAAQTA